MRKKSGFSLMEMMIVLLITAVVAAATAPIISKKMVASAGGDSPWLWAGTNRSIVYNVGGAAKQTANIGDIYTGDDNPRLYIATNSYKIPQIAFKGSGDTIFKLLASNNSIEFSDNVNTNLQPKSVAIGVDTAVAASGATSLGYGAHANADSATALGYNTTATEGAIAIGAGVTAGKNALALGGDANAENATAVGIGSNAGANSLAIGASANASGTDALAIGYGAQAMKTGCVGIVTGGNGYGATGDYSSAYGYKVKADGSYSTALGNQSTAGNSSVAVGYKLSASANSVAIGAGTSDNTLSAGANSVLIGYKSSSAANSLAIGYNSTAYTANCIAIGKDAYAKGSNNIAIGNNTSTYSVDIFTAPTDAIAIGNGAKAVYTNSVAIGAGVNTTTPNQIVLGDANTIVYIPGKLVVDRSTYLGLKQKAGTWGAGSLWSKGSSGSCRGWLQTRSDSGGDYYMTSIKSPVTGLPDAYTIEGIYEAPGAAYANPSDRRLKNVGDAFKGGLAELKKLELFNFTFKKDPNKTPMVGVMAQDLQKVFPNAVFKGEDGFLRIRWDEMFFSMINAIKELDLKITGHDKKFEELQKQNTELQKRLDKLEQRLDKLEKAGKKVK